MNTGIPKSAPHPAAGVGNDDRETLRQLYEQFFPKVYNYFRFRLQDASLCDDLTAKVFLKVVEHFKGYAAEKGSWSAWIFTIARNSLIDHFRANVRKPLPLETAAPLADGAADQAVYLVEQEERNLLLAAVLRLPEREREIIALKFSVGLSNVEIARQTGLGESHVGVIVYRSLAKLREILEKA